MNGQPGDTALTYGLLPPALWADAVRLFREESVSIAGLVGESVWRAFLKDTQATHHPLIVSATACGKVHGLVLTVVDPARYWRSLAIRRPLLTLEILAARWRRGIRARLHPPGAPPADLLQFTTPNVSGRNWRDSAPDIAKIVFIGVDRDSRRRSISRDLYDELHRQLRARGVRRVDACIDWSNLPSIRLHHSGGWQLYARPESIMASYDLCDRREEHLASR